MNGAIRRCGDFMRLIRFEHTLFALPWAIASALMAAGGWPAARTIGWILVAMVGARTAAMTFNRLVDRRFDAANPRTSGRLSATGAIGAGFLSAATASAAAVFVFAAWRLNPLAFRLAIPTLGVLLFYSVTKRFFAWTHVVLGLALGLSPLGAWVAVRGTLDSAAWPAAALGAAVLAWTAGFDIFYACQDVEFDRRVRLRSVPARFGVLTALRMARGFHALVPPLLVLAGRAADLGAIYYVAVALVTALLVYEHALVRAGDPSRVDRAFFTVNVVIGFAVLAGTLGDLLFLGHS